MTRKSIQLAISAVVAAAALPASVAMAGKAARGGVSVQNLRSETIRVVIDGELVGMLPAGGRSAFQAKEGRHTVRLEDVDGDLILARKVSVERGERARVRLGGADSRLIIDNDAQVAMTVKTVDREGRTRRTKVAPGAEAEIPVTAGEVDVSAYYAWFDVDMSIAGDELRLEPGEVERFVLQPLEEAMVRVDNKADQPITLSIDGELLGRVAPASVGYIMAPVGGQLIDIAALGLDAGHRRLRVDPEDGASMGFVMRTGDVEIVNRSRVVARARIGEKDFGLLRPGESRVVELPVGMHDVAFLAPGGALLQERSIRVERDQYEYATFRHQPRYSQDDDLADAYRMHERDHRQDARGRPVKRRHHDDDDHDRDDD